MMMGTSLSLSTPQPCAVSQGRRQEWLFGPEQGRLRGHQAAQSQKHGDAVLTSFVPILVPFKRSEMRSTSFPGEEKLAWYLAFSAVWTH